MTAKRNYTIKIKDERYESYSLRRFLRHVRTIKWEKVPSVYVRISYGNGFWNDGEYTSAQEFNHALEAFLEL